MAYDPQIRDRALQWKLDHPQDTNASIETRFHLKKGTIANWVSQAKKAKGPGRPPSSIRDSIIQDKVERKHLKLLNSRSIKSMKEEVIAEIQSIRPIPKSVIERHRNLIDKQLDYLESMPTGTKEYMMAHTVYRGLVADWQNIPQLDSELKPEGLPDLSTEEGRAQVAMELAGLPAGLLEAAMDSLKVSAK